MPECRFNKYNATSKKIKPTRAMIGQAAARAVAQRVEVAEHTLRRHRVHPHTQDDLAFRATLPSSDD
jgi:hypothetical protein